MIQDVTSSLQSRSTQPVHTRPHTPSTHFHTTRPHSPSTHVSGPEGRVPHGAPFGGPGRLQPVRYDDVISTASFHTACPHTSTQPVHTRPHTPSTQPVHTRFRSRGRCDTLAPRGGSGRLQPIDRAERVFFNFVFKTFVQTRFLCTKAHKIRQTRFVHHTRPHSLSTHVQTACPHTSTHTVHTHRPHTFPVPGWWCTLAPPGGGLGGCSLQYNFVF